jgi:hypothetical protein
MFETLVRCRKEDQKGLFGGAEIEKHGMEFGWADQTGGILWVPTSVKEDEDDVTFSEKTTYLLENYGSILHEDIFKWEKSYINKHRQAAQDSHLLAHCLLKSLIPKGQRKM